MTDVSVDRPYRVAVIGGSAASALDREHAEEVGRGLAAGGAVLICGGRGGVMEAAAKGAAGAGGTTLGFLPGADAGEANPWITLPVPTGLGEARNVLVAGSAECVLAIGGAWGTLSEIAFARTRGLPVGTLGTPPADGLGLPAFTEPAAAVRWALTEAERSRG